MFLFKYSRDSKSGSTQPNTSERQKNAKFTIVVLKNKSGFTFN